MFGGRADSIRFRTPPILACILLGCSATPAPPVADRPAPCPLDASSDPIAPEAASEDSSAPDQPAAAEPEPSLCPPDMVHAEVDFCHHVARRCLNEIMTERDQRRICQRFEGPTRCLSHRREHLSFCIDRYEFPNRQGAHPVGMASWYDAATTCAAAGKRLCWDAEWTAACEGPRELPFPQGWSRDPQSCHIDLPSEMARLDRLHSPDPQVRQAEMDRVDRSVPSGSRPACASEFGVHDLTGNYDEWVNTESLIGVGQWAALKGGSWVRSRNACRPILASHSPGFRFHTLSFRCCKDAQGARPRHPITGPFPPSIPSAGSARYWPGRVLEAEP